MESQNVHVVPIPCGKCLACLINKRRQWTLRILLERTLHEKACFVTLSYAPENLPFSDESWKIGRGVLCLSDLQKFLKRLRKHFFEEDKRLVRYYCAGEYGPTGTHIPHYHLILFGISAEELDPDWFFYQGKSGPIRKDFVRNSLLYKLWNKYGIVHVGDASVNSIAYCAGYVTHKITKENDGITPEFQVMSRRPGLGVEAVAGLAQQINRISSSDSPAPNPRQVYTQGNYWPSGRYILSKLRRVSHVSSGDEEFIRDLLSDIGPAEREGLDLVSYVVNKDNQRRLNLEVKHSLYNQRSKL